MSVPASSAKFEVPQIVLLIDSDPRKHLPRTRRAESKGQARRRAKAKQSGDQVRVSNRRRSGEASVFGPVPAWKPTAAPYLGPSTSSRLDPTVLIKRRPRTDERYKHPNGDRSCQRFQRLLSGLAIGRKASDPDADTQMTSSKLMSMDELVKACVTTKDMSESAGSVDERGLRLKTLFRLNCTTLLSRSRRARSLQQPRLHLGHLPELCPHRQH